MQRHAAIGDAKVKTGDGRWKAIRGISEGKKIYVKANNGYTAEQIAKHEYFHQAADERVVKGIWEEVKRRYEPEVVEELKRKYEEGYEGCYEGGRKIEEEIAADVYSGMNVFEEVGEEIRRYAEDLLEGKGVRQENIDRGGEGSYDGIGREQKKKTRLPRKNGKWEGDPGNGKWFSNLQEVLEVTKGEGIPFNNGRPDFMKWKLGTIKFPIGKLKGLRSDFDLVYEIIKKKEGFSSREEARKWLVEKGLTPHHKNATEIELVPTRLHKNIPHIGSASDLRGGR